MSYSDHSPEANTVTSSPAFRLGWWLFLALVAAVPLALANLSPAGGPARALLNDVFATPKAFALVTLAWGSFSAWAVAVAWQGVAVRFHRMLVVVALLVGWTTISTITSVSPALSITGARGRGEGLAVLISFAVVLFLAVQYVNRSARLRRVCEVAVISGTVVGLYEIAQWAGLDPLSWPTASFGDRVFSTLGNPDMLGAYLVWPLLLSLGLALTESRRPWAVAWWSAAAIALIGLALTLVRAAWAGAALGLGLLVIGVVVSGWRPRRSQAFALAGLAAAVVVALVITELRPQEGLTILERVQAALITETSLGPRVYAWRIAAEGLRERPLLGFGPATFARMFSRYADAEFFAQWPPYSFVVDSAHNYVVETLSALGIVGAGLLCATFGWALVASARTAFPRGAGSERLLVTAVWSAEAAFFVSMLATVTQVGLTFWLWLGAGLLVALSARDVAVRRAAVARAGAVTVLVLAAAVVAWAAASLGAERAYTVGLTSGDATARASSVERAVALAPLDGEYRYALASLRMAEFSAAADGGGLRPSDLEARSRAGLGEFETILRADPWDLRTTLGYLSALNDTAASLAGPEHAEAALSAAKQALEKWPDDPQVLLQYADAAAAVGDSEGASRALERSTRTDPTLAAAWRELGSVRAASGDPAGALAAYRKALALDSADAEAKAAVERLEGMGGP